MHKFWRCVTKNTVSLSDNHDAYMERPKVLVVGPFSEQAGGVITFQRNLIHHSDLKERWDFIPYNISRPAKKNKNISTSTYIFSFFRTKMKAREAPEESNSRPVKPESTIRPLDQAPPHMMHNCATKEQ